MEFKRWLRANWDRAGAWLFVALGVVLLILGWEGVSNTAYPAEQLPYILSGGIGGALMVAMGATLLISADLRDEWQKLDRIEKKLDQLTPGPSANGSHAALPPPPGEEEREPLSTEAPLSSEAPLGQEALATETPARRTRRRPLTARRDDS